MKITFQAISKINIGLHVKERRNDGYHNIESLFMPLALSDTITIENNTEELSCTVNKKDIPSGIENLAYRAADAFFRYTNIKDRVSIHIDKHIPQGYGLGGGSSDAAFIINVLDGIYETNLTYEIKKTIALEIGTDVVYFLRPRPALVEGKGDIVTHLGNFSSDLWVLLYFPEISFKTKEAYTKLSSLTKRKFYGKIIFEYLIQKRFSILEDYVFNDFEMVVKDFIDTEKIRHRFKELGALLTGMTGSGTGFYGIFDSLPALKQGKWIITRFYL